MKPISAIHRLNNKHGDKSYGEDTSQLQRAIQVAQLAEAWKDGVSVN